MSDKEKTSAADEESKSEGKKKSKADKAAANKGGIGKYFRDLKSDFKKITWPTKRELANNTAVVMGVIIMIGVLVAFVDWGLLQLYHLVIKG